MAGRRVQFEAEQLQAELAETDEFVTMLERDMAKYREQDAILQRDQAQVEGSLTPIRSGVRHSAAGTGPPRHGERENPGTGSATSEGQIQSRVP